MNNRVCRADLGAFQRVQARIIAVGAAFLCLAMCHAPALATGTFSGTVVDSVSGEPLIGANIFLLRTGLGGVSDREGRFRVASIPAGG
jgi:hypothetical protein